jgi:hypothetical protein
MSPLPDGFTRIAEEVDEVELEHPDFITVLKIVWHSIEEFFIERPGQIIGSTFLLLMLWGTHGHLEALEFIWPAWNGPGAYNYDGIRPSVVDVLPWDLELISFWTGALLLVGVPGLIIRYGFEQSLSEYGLGLPPPGRRSLATWTFITLTLVSLPAFWYSAGHAGMQELYPYYRPFSSTGAFVLYQISILPFYLAIEFIFRGYLLFGLAGVRDEEVEKTGGGIEGVFYFHRYALLIQMLSYTAWHLGKPIPEIWGTLVWGLAAGATAYAVRSIWPIVLSHWLLNVFMDVLILQNIYGGITG